MPAQGSMGGGVGNVDPAFQAQMIGGLYGQTPASSALATANLKGQAAGATETGFLNSLPPSLAGLMSGGSLSNTSGSTGTTGTTGTTGVAGTGAPGTGGASGASPIPQISPTDMTASNAATFANAKNTVGSTARASLDALNGELGATGMMGGGAQVQGTKDIVANGQNQLGAVTNQNAITDAAQTQADALANLTAATTGRGQNIQQQEAQATEALAANNQQFQQSYLKQQQLQNMLQMALSGINTGIGASNSTASASATPNAY